MQPRLPLLMVLLLSTTLFGGCESAPPPPSDLGGVVFEVPRVEGADQLYPMPQLGPPLERRIDDPFALP